MGVFRRSAVGVAALVAVTTALACHDGPRPARTMAAALPSPEAIHTELHRRQLVARLVEVAAEVKAAEVPTLCRRPSGDLAEARALVVTQSMLVAIAEARSSVPAHHQALNAAPFRTLAEAARGFAERERATVSAAIDRIADHRYLAVVDVGRHRAPNRRGDRTITPGALEGEVVLVDVEQLEPLCRGEVQATTSSSMNAYGDLDEDAFARDLAVRFLRAVETQLNRATGGMKLAWDEDLNPRLASHGASSPFAGPP